MRAIPSLVAVTLSALLVVPAMAEPAKPDVNALIKPDDIVLMRKAIETEIVRVSVNAQNERYANLAQDAIDSLDQQWRKEREASDKPLIAATLSNPLSVYLARIQGRSLGLYAEIFVMDKNGLNVGQSSITSDFWQGDEGKFQKTFDVGKDAVFIDEPEWDDDNKIWRGQVNFTLTDADGQTPIGAVTMEVNLTELQRKRATGS